MEVSLSMQHGRPLIAEVLHNRLEALQLPRRAGFARLQRFRSRVPLCLIHGLELPWTESGIAGFRVRSRRLEEVLIELLQMNDLLVSAPDVIANHQAREVRSVDQNNT